MSIASHNPGSSGGPCITRAQNDLLFDDAGRAIIDLFSANGTTWLGHAHPAITAPVTEQLQRVWLTGGLGTPAHAAARAALDAWLPPTHATAAIYSTGMEAAEFALRVARVYTGRNGALGFAHGMHGKSLATSTLCWDNADGISVPDYVRLPFVDAAPEHEILERVAHWLERKTIGAVLIEPVLGSGGGHVASPQFCEKLIALCFENGALCVFDELLTGFHRTGPRFVSSTLVRMPDVLLLGKSIGNGMAASAVVARRDIAITPRMLPGSTYAGNPLACSAIHATLAAMQSLDLACMALHIGRRVQTILGQPAIPGATLRGIGAMWMLELPPHIAPESVARACFAQGVFLSYTGRFLRILPAATITDAHLTQALTIVRAVLAEAVDE